MRPHHSLCIQFFTGKGYSKEFVTSMARIIEFLNENNPVISLTDKCDVICKKCPNNIKGVCTSKEKVSGIDKRCIERYSLAFGDRVQWSELKKAAFEKVINCRKLGEVCQNCQWSGICMK